MKGWILIMVVLGCGAAEEEPPVGRVIGSTRPFVPERPPVTEGTRLSSHLERAWDFCTAERSADEAQESGVAVEAEAWIVTLSAYSRWRDPRVRETVARCLALQATRHRPTKLREAFWYDADEEWGQTLRQRGETLSWPPESLWSHIDSLCAESRGDERCRARLTEYVVVEGRRAPPTAIISIVRSASTGELAAGASRGAVERTVHRLDPADGWSGVPLVGTDAELGQLGAFAGFRSADPISTDTQDACSPRISCIAARGELTCTAGVRDYGGRMASRYSGPCIRAMERIQPPACASQPDACSLEHDVFESDPARRAELCRIAARGAWLEQQTHIGDGRFNGWRDLCQSWRPRFAEEAEAQRNDNPAYAEQLRKLLTLLR